MLNLCVLSSTTRKLLGALTIQDLFFFFSKNRIEPFKKVKMFPT